MNEWELVFKAISDPALILDNDHRVLAANPAAESAAGFAPGELIGRRCHDAFHCKDHAPEGCPHVALGKLQMPVTLEMEMEALGRFRVNLHMHLHGPGISLKCIPDVIYPLEELVEIVRRRATA